MPDGILGKMKHISAILMTLAMFALSILPAGKAEALSCIPPPITYIASCRDGECTDGFEIHRVHVGNVCETRIEVWDPRGNFEEVTTGLIGDAAQSAGIYEFNVEDECLSWVLYQLPPDDDDALAADGRTWEEFCRDKAGLTLLSEDTSADRLAGFRAQWTEQEQDELVATKNKHVFGSIFFILAALLVGFGPWFIRLLPSKRHADIRRWLRWMIPLQLFGILYLTFDPFLVWSYYPAEATTGILLLAVMFNVLYVVIRRMKEKR